MVRLARREYDAARKRGKPVKRTKKGFWLLEARERKVRT
jgi:hypothetical protein